MVCIENSHRKNLQYKMFLLNGGKGIYDAKTFMDLQYKMFLLNKKHLKN